MKAIRSPLKGAGLGMTAGVAVAGGVGVGAAETVEVGEAFGVGEADPVSVIVRSGVPVGDAFSVVGGPIGRASVGDVAGAGSTVQAMRKSNRDRTPASRMFARGRCAFKLAESDKNNFMAATLIANYGNRKTGKVPSIHGSFTLG